MGKVLVVGSYAQALVNFRGPLLREMVRHGCDVSAAAPENDRDVIDSLKQLGVNYYSIKLDRNGLNPVNDLLTFFSLIILFKKVKPEVVFFYTIKPVVYGSIVARLVGVSKIFSMITGLGYVFSGGSWKNMVVGWLAGRLYTVALKYNKCIFFQNPDDLFFFRQRRFVKKTHRLILVNGSGIELDRFSTVGFPSSISFLLIVRLIRDKGIFEYVDAAKQVKARYPGVHFRLAGWRDSNPHAVSKDYIEHLKYSKDIEFLGRLQDVRPAFSDCSVFVFPSYREGIPRAVLEAMAMGRPVITTDTPGCRETVIDGQNGFLVPVRDVDALVEAMERFINHPGLIEKMGNESRKFVEKKFDVRVVNENLLKAMGLY